MKVDIHKQESQYYKKIEEANNMPESKNKEYMKAYIDWHNYQIEQGAMAHSSSIRSLRHALSLCDYFHPDISKATQTKVEQWFSEEMNKEKVHKTGSGYLKPTGKKRSPETLEDFSTQAIKFFKFVRFLDKDKPLHLFSSKRSPMPEQCEFIGIDISKRKVYEKPKVKQQVVKELVEHLRSKGSYNNDLTGVLCAFLNDSGMRFSECCTLRIKDVVPEEDYLVITLQESKTRTRTIVSILAKPYLVSWLSKHPDKNNPNALLFCNRDGKPVNYDALRKCFITSIEELNIEWKSNSSFHYFRHLFASRATCFPDFYMRYWMGWHDNSMRSHYSNNTYLECLKYYKQMLREENNPMLNNYLSVLEKEDKTLTKSMQERLGVLEKVLSKFVNSQEELEKQLEKNLV
jgi:site-specific recombinase XerD